MGNWGHWVQIWGHIRPLRSFLGQNQPKTDQNNASPKYLQFNCSIICGTMAKASAWESRRPRFKPRLWQCKLFVSFRCYQGSLSHKESYAYFLQPLSPQVYWAIAHLFECDSHCARKQICFIERLSTLWTILRPKVKKGAVLPWSDPSDHHDGDGAGCRGGEGRKERDFPKSSWQKNGWGGI